MVMNFSNAFRNEALYTNTENGALALRSTGDALLDLFGVIGALRGRKKEVRELFQRAFVKDRVLATKMAFYARDFRNGGLGERETFRQILVCLADLWPEFVLLNLENIPAFGRWDDLLCLLDTKLRREVVGFLLRSLTADMNEMAEGRAVSLLAKWLPTGNDSSKAKRKYAAIITSEIDARQYRKDITDLRTYLNIVEKNLSRKDYSRIKYPEVPAKAMLRYRKAFRRNDEENFLSYMIDVKSGKKEIKAGTLFPYDLTYKLLYNREESEDVIEAQWNALPNYLSKGANALVMADVSGSMTGQPMATSIGLATYFAQRNVGALHGLYMTYSAQPRFIDISKMTSLRAIVDYVVSENVGYSTDLQKAFSELLNFCLRNSLPQSEVPKAIIVVSDMEIDRYAASSHHTSFLSEMEREFEFYGYEMPKIVFWNVEARHTLYHGEVHHPKVQFVSGSSAGAFKGLIANLDKSAYDAMVATLSDPIFNVLSFPS